MPRLPAGVAHLRQHVLLLWWLTRMQLLLLRLHEPRSFSLALHLQLLLLLLLCRVVDHDDVMLGDHDRLTVRLLLLLLLTLMHVLHLLLLLGVDSVVLVVRREHLSNNSVNVNFAENNE